MSDEVAPKRASEDPKSLQNGLGLDTLLPKDGPITKPSNKSPKPADKAVEKVVDAKVKGTESKGDAKEDAKDEPPDIATISKQLKDTRDYATKVNQTNLDLKKSHASLLEEVKTLKERLDGTYVEKPTVAPEQQSIIDKFMARVEVDNAVMIEKYGAETIQKLIWDADGPYQQLEIMDPALKLRVTNAQRPVAEAMKIVEEHEFFKKYGHDPNKIKDAIIAEAREELIAELKQELKGKPIESVNSLTGMNGAPREVQRAAAKVGVVPDLNKVFPTFQNAAT